MDWTMVANADNEFKRIETILYLAILRYQVDAIRMGRKIFTDFQKYGPPKLPIIQEIKDELKNPTNEFRLGGYDNLYLREYLGAIVSEYYKCHGSKK